MDSEYALSLSANPVFFESPRLLTTVFYDHSAKLIFTTVQVDGRIRIMEENVITRVKKTFLVSEKTGVLSLNFSPDRQFLSMQSHYVVHFVAFSDIKNRIVAFEFSQQAREQHNSIVASHWVSNNSIIFITNSSLELYKTDYQRRRLKFLKALSLQVSWVRHYSMSNFFVMCTGVNAFQPVSIENENFNKSTKIDVINENSQMPYKQIKESDMTLTYVYGQLRILIILHPQNDDILRTDVAVYTVNKALFVRKTHVIRLQINGRFAVNVLDDLIILHHQKTKVSYIYDIGSFVREDSVTILQHPIVKETTIRPTKIPDYELYSLHWVTFQPDIIIDVFKGYFWHIHLNLKFFMRQIRDECCLVDFLLERSNGKDLLIELLKEKIICDKLNLDLLSKMFNRLNMVYKNKLQSKVGSNAKSSTSVAVQIFKPISVAKIIMTQSDIYTRIFSKICKDFSLHMEVSFLNHRKKCLVWILIEYICSLNDFGIPVQNFINELLIDTVISNKAFDQLHQILQYHVISDSKPLACVLLSLESVYPPVQQLAMDMLQRLSNSTDDVIEILLSKSRVIQALKYREKYATNADDNIPYRKYLDVALTSEDPNVFYSVFCEFRRRDRTNDKVQLMREEQCEIFIKEFLKWFDAKYENSLE